jgi:exodeoxyribonuclease-5
MEYTNQQTQGIDDSEQWFCELTREDWPQRTDQQVFRVFGTAGTGKTSIAREIANRIPGRVIFACFTGKAAHILTTKGAPAQTIHSLIYLPKTKCSARLRELREELLARPPGTHRELESAIKEEEINLKRPFFSLNLDSEIRQAALLIVDEVSMINEEMALDLMSFNIPILVLGDPGQLPPVKGSGYFMEGTPDVMLTEVHRQAKESAIIALATDVREGRAYRETELTVPKGKLKIADLAEFDQILVGTNKTRQIINAEMRDHLGFEPGVPVTGDRLICTRNDADAGLLNGGQWEVLSCVHGDDTRLILGIRAVDGEETLNVTAHPHTFRGEEIPYYEIREAQCFEFAYAITVHKAQGSEWSSVCFVDEAHKFPNASQEFRRQFRYTAITRAAETLTVIK